MQFEKLMIGKGLESQVYKIKCMRPKLTRHVSKFSPGSLQTERSSRHLLGLLLTCESGVVCTTCLRSQDKASDKGAILV